MAKKTKIFMCPPDFYGIEYAINPWMNLNKQTTHDTAIKQWNSLYELLTKTIGAEVVTIKPQKKVA